MLAWSGLLLVLAVPVLGECLQDQQTLIRLKERGPQATVLVLSCSEDYRRKRDTEGLMLVSATRESVSQGLKTSSFPEALFPEVTSQFYKAHF